MVSGVIYRIYKFADHDVMLGGALKYGDHSLMFHALKRRNCFVHRFRIVEVRSCIKNYVEWFPDLRGFEFQIHV